MAPKSKAGQEPGREPKSDKELEEYRQKRERNNEAVKKSRQKSRNRALETSVRAEQLKRENEELEEKLRLLVKERGLLKELLLSSTGAGRRKKQGVSSDTFPKPESKNEISSSMQIFGQVVPNNEMF